MCGAPARAPQDLQRTGAVDGQVADEREPDAPAPDPTDPVTPTGASTVIAR